jgi:hypothetical protein
MRDAGNRNPGSRWFCHSLADRSAIGISSRERFWWMALVEPIIAIGTARFELAFRAERGVDVVVGRASRGRRGV